VCFDIGGIAQPPRPTASRIVAPVLIDIAQPHHPPPDGAASPAPVSIATPNTGTSERVNFTRRVSLHLLNSASFIKRSMLMAMNWLSGKRLLYC
jgi:hypothetical protein